jgi:protein-tyrosine-phosphatase/DNA-binding transcriptional ArsR family regulator
MNERRPPDGLASGTAGEPDQADVTRRARMHAALGEPVRLAIVDQLVLGDASPGELGTRFAIPTNLLAHHLKVLTEAGIVRRVRSEGDRRRQYVQLRLDDAAVAALTGTRLAPPWTDDAGPRRVVFVCTANSARSQLAGAAWRRVSSLPVASAGTRPGQRVHPAAVETGRRHGLDLTGATTSRVEDVVSGADDLLVAVCDSAHEELTTAALGNPQPRAWLHWHIADPVPTGSDEAFETAYNEITERVGRLAAALAPPDQRAAS